MPPTPKSQIAAAYSAAADHHDAEALSFLRRFGERTVARAELRPGEFVLDVCCGAGSTALPAARGVAPGGRVIGIDLAPPLLDLARRKAAAQGIVNAEFRHADFDQVFFRPQSFDAVICQFGIFFFPDMAGTLKKMWRFLRPGGRLVVTTWGPGAFEPANTLFWDAVRRERPDLEQTRSARMELSEPGAVARLFSTAGIEAIEEPEAYDHPLSSAEDWWTIVLGSSHRGRVDQLTAEQRERVRQSCLTLTAGSIKMPVVYTVARVEYGLEAIRGRPGGQVCSRYPATFLHAGRPADLLQHGLTKLPVRPHLRRHVQQHRKIPRRFQPQPHARLPRLPLEQLLQRRRPVHPAFAPDPYADRNHPRHIDARIVQRHDVLHAEIFGAAFSSGSTSPRTSTAGPPRSAPPAARTLVAKHHRLDRSRRGPPVVIATHGLPSLLRLRVIPVSTPHTATSVFFCQPLQRFALSCDASSATFSM